MITPLFMPPNGMRTIRQWREEGIIKNLYFDSGGFYVQMGRIEYIDLYYRLLKFYQQEQWADYYVLPDNVPISSDSQEVIWQKVKNTVEYSELFFDEMPDKLKSKSIPVIHGYINAQLDYCLENYLRLGISYLGFGSFSTSGDKSSVNRLTQTSYRNIQMILQELNKQGIKLHGFGVSTPPVVYLLKKMNVYSFDSIGWMKTAGYGKVYLPYIRAYNITYRDLSAQTITEKTFSHMKEITGHQCVFCQSFHQLHESRYSRILHNLSVIMDMVDYEESDNSQAILEEFSPSYYKILRDGNG